MNRIKKIEKAMDASYHEFQKFSNLSSMTDKINHDIDVWFTKDELDAILDLLKDYISYLVIAREDEIRKLEKRYCDHDKDVLDQIRAEIELHRGKTQGIDPNDLVGDCLDIIDSIRQKVEGDQND